MISWSSFENYLFISLFMSILIEKMRKTNDYSWIFLNIEKYNGPVYIFLNIEEYNGPVHIFIHRHCSHGTLFSFIFFSRFLPLSVDFSSLIISSFYPFFPFFLSFLSSFSSIIWSLFILPSFRGAGQRDVKRVIPPIF